MTSGLNPAIPKCFYCQKDKNELIIDKRLVDYAQDKMTQIHGNIIDMNPCSKCEDMMKQGIVLITIDSAKSTKGWNIPPAGSRTSVFVDTPKQSRETTFWLPNPYRTGGWMVVKDEAVTRMFDEKTAEWAINNRFMFIEHEAAEHMGLLEMAKTAPKELEN